MTALWRKAYDAIERPLAAGSEAWIQSDTFMDLATHSVRLQRRVLNDVQQATERWLHLLGWVSRGDMIRLANQVASLERQLRELRGEAEQRQRPLLDGRSGGSRGRSGRARTAPRTPSEARPKSSTGRANGRASS